MAKKLEGFIKFVHSDGKEYHFVTKNNPLTGNQMFSWDNWRGCYASDVKHVKQIIKNIFKRANILETDLNIDKIRGKYDYL